MAKAAADDGIHVSPLSLYRLEEGRPGLYMGYASVPEADLVKSAGRLAAILKAASCPRHI